MTLDSTAAEEPLESSADLAPVLELLHTRQQQRGYLAKDEILELARTAGISPAELYGIITAYPRFRLARGATRAVCRGPACTASGAHAVAQALHGSTPAACLGLCDQPVAVLTDDGPRVARPTTPNVLAVPEAPQAAIGVALSAFFGRDDPFDAVEAALRRSPDDLIRTVTDSGLQGRGGAGFSTGRKWQAVRDAPGEGKVVVCNADESEPGTFKDRHILDHQARRLLAGMAVAAHATGSTAGIIYLRYEYRRQLARLHAEIARLRAEGGLGGQFDVVVRRGAGAYVCGEETALLNSLEGKRPIPRDRPPYPTTRGLFGAPTLIHNVETLTAVPAIVTRGATWYRNAGLPKLYCVSGDVPAPGVFELPMSITARELIERAGGDSATVKAFTLGGLSGGLCPPSQLDDRLDFEATRQRGAHLGSGALIVLSVSRCLVRFVRNAMRFFADESCGKCFPCRIGVVRLRERLEAATDYAPLDSAELHDIIEVLDRGSACGLGPAAALLAGDVIRHFGNELLVHATGRCPAGECSGT